MLKVGWCDVSQEFLPEVVFCDIMLAGQMSGYAFAKAARQDQSLGEVCIVAVSGWEGPEHERQAYEAGFDRVLKKPVELADLSKILQTLPRRVGEPSQELIADCERSTRIDSGLLQDRPRRSPEFLSLVVQATAFLFDMLRRES